jgi:hypothetical protein
MLMQSANVYGSGHVVAFNLVDDSEWGPVSLNLETGVKILAFGSIGGKISIVHRRVLVRAS